MLKLFYSKESAICLLFVIFQQVLVALSTIFIAEIAKSIASDQFSWVYLGLFVGSLIIVYIPATLSRVYLEKVRYNAQYRYSLAFVDAHRGQIHLNNQDEEAKVPYITTEGQQTINCVSFFIYDLASTVLNVSASLVALSYVLNPTLILSYGLGFFLLFGFMSLTHKHILCSSERAQQTRSRLLGQLLKSWQNITINNEYNFNIWKIHFEQSFRTAQRENVHNESVKQTLSSLGMLISMMPILGTLAYFFYNSSGNLAFQALIVATLPRQIQMIQNLDIIIQNFSEWTDIKQRLIGLKNALKASKNNLEERIKWDKIQINSSFQQLKISSLNEFQGFIKLPSRLTIRGENGSGKTSLLKCIKARYGGYYLPANPKMSFQNSNWPGLSTGEQIIATLKEICDEGNIKENLILLDEWDANLDSFNRKKLSHVIDQFSKNYTIIEVVHRQ